MAVNEAEHVQLVINDHLGIVEGLFGYIKGDEQLSEYFIRGLQSQFTAHQDHTEAITPNGSLIKIDLIKGDYKRLPNNPRRNDGVIHQYCPPELTKEEMETLINVYRDAENSYPVEVRSAWLHHRFTQIHPFQDGNGRVARALASLVFLRDGLFPLVVRESDREEYINALENADDGDLSKLTHFFARRQREAILKALGLEQQAQQSKYADDIIKSAMSILRSKTTKEVEKIAIVYEYADKLQSIVNKKFASLHNELGVSLRELTPPGMSEKFGSKYDSGTNAAQTRHYFQKEIVDIASRFDYYANLQKYRTWSRLNLSTNSKFDFVISFHGYGPGNSGIIAASAFTYVKVQKEDAKGFDHINLNPASMEIFQLNYAEPYENAEIRFHEWFDATLAIAMAEWKRNI
ncbi:MAG: Fic family protein [Fibrobacteres bacterium]|nr:Fic family protein [Fibrobacterota bacterium]